MSLKAAAYVLMAVCIVQAIIIHGFKVETEKQNEQLGALYMRLVICTLDKTKEIPE